MSQEQNKNYEQMNSTITLLQSSLKKCKAGSDFHKLRQENIKLRSLVKKQNLHPNARKKFFGWLFSLFHKINTAERKFYVDLCTEVDEKISILESDLTKPVSIPKLRQLSDNIKAYVERQKKLNAKQKGKKQATQQKELKQFENSIGDIRNRLKSVQRKRGNHFQQIRLEYETELAMVEVKINDLDAQNVKAQHGSLITQLKNLDKKKKRFHPAKQTNYTERIDELFKQLKEIKKESFSLEKQNASQASLQRYNEILDKIEDELDASPLKIAQINSIKNKLQENAWAPLAGRTAKGGYKVFLVRSHRNDLFDRMRSLKALANEKKADNKAHIKQCKENCHDMEQVLTGLYDAFEECHESFSKNMNIKKQDMFKLTTDLKERLKVCQQQIKTGHLFATDRRDLRDSANSIWSEIDALRQEAQVQTWSLEWLHKKILQNNEMGGVMLQLIPNLPSPK